MNRKLVLVPIALLALLVLFLAPLVPVTVIQNCPSNALCMRIPSHASKLPDGSYSYVIHESVTSRFFNVGGFVDGYGMYLVTIMNLSTVMGLATVVLPLSLVDAALFALSFKTAGGSRVDPKIDTLSV